MNSRLIALITARPIGSISPNAFETPIEQHRFSHVFASHSDRNHTHLQLASGTPGDHQVTQAKVKLSGQVSPFSRLTIRGLATTTTADRQGNFQFDSVSLNLGANDLVVEAKDIFERVRYGTVRVQRSESDRNQIIIDWNDTLLSAIAADKTAPPKAARAMAIVNSAIYDAVNSITDAGAAYQINLEAPKSANPEAAAAEAAYQTLKALFPNQTARFDAVLAQTLGKVPDGPGESEGRAIGQAVATAILQTRSNDGANTPAPYIPANQSDSWRSTAPGGPAPVLPQWMNVQPFSLASGSQFRPNTRPEITSEQFGRELEEVRQLGGKTGSDRTLDQTQTAQFWADGAGSFTPPGHWIQITKAVAQQQGNSLQENARLFAQVSLALADAGIAAWDAKYSHNQFRPIQAIRNGAPGATWATDTTWTPLLATPNFPDYVSGHSTFSGAASQVLARFYGDNVPFSTTSPLPELAGVTRSFTRFSQAAEEAGRSRIYGGIHWESSNQAGLRVGRSIGDWVFDRFLLG